jgi:hypothetical protein
MCAAKSDVYFNSEKSAKDVAVCISDKRGKHKDSFIF